MAVKWKPDFNPNELANRIEKTRKVAEDGSITFESGIDFKIFDTLLYSMLEFTEPIPEIEARGIVVRSIFDAGRKGEINPTSLLSEVNTLERNYLVQPLVRFSLATSISIVQHTQLNRIYVGPIQIIFERQHPRRFANEAIDISKEARRSLYSDPPTDYTAVRVHVSAKSHNEATNKALDTLDLIRGLWNLYENRKHFTRWSVGGVPIPVNKIILGPYHTLHFPNGKIASSSTWWYEPSYLGSVRPHRFDDLPKLYNYTNDMRRKLNKSKYKNTIEYAIVRYTRALDDRNWNNAYIRLWGIMEALTDTIKGSHEETIRRAAYIYEDYEYQLQILKHLRDYRNRSVHADAENSEMESYLYQLKYIIENLLYFHLGNKFGFKSIEEAGKFLNLPRDKNALNSRAGLAKNALKFLRYIK